MAAGVLALVTATALAAPALADGTTPGQAPADTMSPSLITGSGDSGTGGLQVVVNERGNISRAVAGTAGGILRFTKPAAATVRGAYLAYATTGFTYQPLSQPLTLDGQAVPLTNQIPSDINSYNYFTDVTAIVKPIVDAAPAGEVDLSVGEPEPWLTDGEALVVIFDDPNVAVTQSVSVLYGALNPNGDVYRVHLAQPVDLTDPATKLEMSLGISYSYQTGGSPQYSTVQVNGQQLTSSAGGEDDGFAGNGGLITVGGEGDSISNPTDANAPPTNPRSDDELYDLRPFVKTGDQSIEVRTDNPSLDDNIFLAVFGMNPPVTTIDTGNLPVTPQSQEALVGDNVDFQVGPSPTIGLTNYHAAVVLGPNTGQPVNFWCVSECLVNDYPTYMRLSMPAGSLPGTDTIRIWDDTNADGVWESGEPHGTTTVTWDKPIHAVGMGDSYSSGEGVDPYDAGTDDDTLFPGGNQCHRSRYAYVRDARPPWYKDTLYNAANSDSATRLDLIACSGAKTINVMHYGQPQAGEPATQLDQNKLGPDTDLVTLTLGGDDVGFAPVLKACALSNTDCTDPTKTMYGMQIFDYARYMINQVLPYRLEETLSEIRQDAPNATIVLLGYPQIFPGPDGDSSCLRLKRWSTAEQAFFNQAADELDQVQSRAAAIAGVYYVSVLDRFAGHAACDALSEWTAGPTWPDRADLLHIRPVGSGSFHPTYDGQVEGYAGALNEWLLTARSSAPLSSAGLPMNPAPAVAPLAAAATPADPGDLGDLHVLAGDPTDTRFSCYEDGLVRSGATARVVGYGFKPGADVKIGWTSGDSSHTEATLGTAVADEHGWVDTTVDVPQVPLDSEALITASGDGAIGAPLKDLAMVGAARVCPGSFQFSGFFAPVDNEPVVNTMNAGRTVPMKFSLHGYQGLDVIEPGYPTSRRVDCQSGATSSEVEQTGTAGSSSLSYDPVTDTYNYTWQTDSGWEGTCREFTMQLIDGTQEHALFSFR